METKTTSNNSNNALIIIGIWAIALLIAFISFRGEDLGKFGSLIGRIGKAGIFGFSGFAETFGGLLIALLIFAAWYGLGSFKLFYIEKFFGSGEANENRNSILDFVRNMAAGAAIWSFIWFFLGLFGLYSKAAAIISVAIGIALAAFGFLKIKSNQEEKEVFDLIGKIALGLTAFLSLLALISAMAPPIAKDTLLYHFSVPKAFAAAGNNSVIEGNIASYLALGTEMHATWAMLAGQLFNARIGEAAAGSVIWGFAILLVLGVYGWARESGADKKWAIIAALMIASIPTFYHAASSGYIDPALALYIMLAIHAIGRWWDKLENSWLAALALFLGAALSVKLTALFAIMAIGLIILLRLREEQNKEASNLGKIISSSGLAFLGAAVFASPWYLRDWRATGSPIFPFYMNLWNGAAAGWDAERSGLFQIINSGYGGKSKGIIDFLISPFTLSIKAQPELPEFFDGVLGIAFLFGIPLIIWAFRKKLLKTQLNIALIAAGVLFFCWLFTSQQLRYLMPVFPILAVAICYSCQSLSRENKFLEKGLAAIILMIAVVSSGVSLAWFALKDPLGAALGGESRDAYLSRNIDYYPYYQAINNELPADSKIWLINMRRDSYLIEKPYFSDYMFEDWTLKKMAEESKNLGELQAKAKAMGITHILARHDFLLDYKRTVLVDEKRDEKINREKIEMVKALLFDNKNLIKSDNKFSLVKLP